MLPQLQRALFLIKIGSLAGKEQVPVYLMAVKVRAVNAGEPGDTTNGYPAAAAHAGAINHYRV